jgi:DNA-binding transcriptional ArsR family regulator
MKQLHEFQWCAARLKALAEPERLRIVTALLDGPKHVGAIAEELDEAIVKVSHHLGVLKHNGLVLSQKQGRFVEYALHPGVFVVANSDDEEPHLDLGCCRLELPATRAPRRRRA